MKVLKPRVSYTDLQNAPEDGRRYELYDGEVFVVPSPVPFHQLVGYNGDLDVAAADLFRVPE